MRNKKNIIHILADDLGRGMLSCYGQKIIETPNIDRLAETGKRFTNYCTTAFCAPSRASFICGIHDAHAGRWSYTPGGSRNCLMRQLTLMSYKKFYNTLVL